MLRLLLAVGLFSATLAAFPDCSPQLDGHVPYNGTAGPFAPTKTLNASWQGKPLVAIIPSGVGPFPLVAFMHGSTGEVGMYGPNLDVYASHGFVVVFPYIKSAAGDKNPLTTNTNGEYLLHAVAFAENATADPSSPFHGLVDTSRVVLAGHSMGATCSIMAGTRVPRPERVKLVVTQHPGICGPFGPPPWPATWLESDLAKVSATFPLLFTTATNDGAFWPAPQTAAHEFGCFNGALPANATSPRPHPAIFVQWSAAACNKDGSRPPYDASGHDCPFKSGVETPWVLTALKLYAQQDGRTDSACHRMLLAQQGEDSLAADPRADKVVFRLPTSSR